MDLLKTSIRSRKNVSVEKSLEKCVETLLQQRSRKLRIQIPVKFKKTIPIDEAQIHDELANIFLMISKA